MIKYQTRQTGEAPSYCKLCDVRTLYCPKSYWPSILNLKVLAYDIILCYLQVEVFNVLFVKMDKDVYNVYCVTCAQKCVLDYFVLFEFLKVYEDPNAG